MHICTIYNILNEISYLVLKKKHMQFLYSFDELTCCLSSKLIRHSNEIQKIHLSVILYICMFAYTNWLSTRISTSNKCSCWWFFISLLLLRKHVWLFPQIMACIFTQIRNQDIPINQDDLKTSSKYIIKQFDALFLKAA